MFCVTWWCSVKIAKGVQGLCVTDGFKLDVVSKVSNKYLGQIYVDMKLCMFQRLQDMQLQASCLMRHATRFPRDVLFWVDDKELLPHNFAYKTKLELHEEANVNEFLEKARKGIIGRISMLSMMWNEDDSWAEHSCKYVDFKVNKKERAVTVNECVYGPIEPFPMELLHLENKNVTEWRFSDDCPVSRTAKRVGFLKHAQRCTKVEITGYTSHHCVHLLQYVQYEGKDLTNLLSGLM